MITLTAAAAAIIILVGPVAHGYLVSVHVLMRHGDRTPTSFYPNDPFNDAKLWPEGIGELNDRGRNRIRQSGHLYREIYGSFLRLSDGWPERVWSSPRNRAVQTALLFLESFLHGTGVSFEVIHDGKMLSTGVPCAESARLWLDQITEAPDIHSYLEEKREFIRYLEQETGANYLNATPFTLRDLEFLATTLEIERDEYGLPVPEFARDEKNIAQLDDLKRHAFYFDWRLPQIQRLRVGILLGQIRDNIRSLVEKQNVQKQRFFLYTAHDVNLVLLMQALGVYDQIDCRPPSYSSALVFEHHRHDSHSEHYIKLIYRQILANTTVAETGFSVADLILTMPDCADWQCPWMRFQEVIEPLAIRPDDWEMACSRATNSKPMAMAAMAIIFLAQMFLMI